VRRSQNEGTNFTTGPVLWLVDTAFRVMAGDGPMSHPGTGPRGADNSPWAGAGATMSVRCDGI